MLVRKLCYLLLTLCVLCLSGLSAHAQGLYYLNLRATRPVVLANGSDKTLVFAEVRDPSGRQAPNGLEVLFQTTLGTLSTSRAQTFGGVAQVELSSNLIGVAKVTAIIKGSSNVTDVAFTDNPEEIRQGTHFAQISGSKDAYISYSVADKVIQASGSESGIKVAFRNITITADQIQLRCDDLVIRAVNNVVIKRGRQTLKVSRLYYSLQLAQGFAIAEYKGPKDVRARLQAVAVSGMDLALEPLKTPIPNTYLAMPNVENRLLVVAKGITYFPGDRLQFRQPKFYQDQVPILSFPYYEMSLNSQELFSDQFISLGTSGFGLELPLYLSMSPTDKTVLYLRHQQQIGRSYFAQEAGWGVDLLKSYSTLGDRRAEGVYGFTSLMRGDWGFRWMHSQEVNPKTQSTFYVDLPQHQGILTNINLNQQGKALRWGGTLSAGTAFVSTKDRSYRGDVYVETQPHKLLGMKDYLYTFQTEFLKAGAGSNVATESVALGNESTQTLRFRTFTHPIPLSKSVNLSQAFSVGHVFTNQGNSGTSQTATFSLDYLIPKAGSLSLVYDYIKQPAGPFTANGNNRLGVNYNLAASKRTQVTVFGSTYLDSAESTAWVDFIYRISPEWRVFLGGTFQTFDGQNFNDLQFTIGRRLGARELQLTYSTYLKRISFDLTATRF